MLNGAKLETEGYTIRKLAREVLLQVNAESGEDNQLDLNFDVGDRVSGHDRYPQG